MELAILKQEWWTWKYLGVLSAISHHLWAEYIRKYSICQYCLFQFGFCLTSLKSLQKLAKLPHVWEEQPNAGKEKKSWPEFLNSRSIIHHSTYINEIFSLENICDFIHDNVIFGPSKSIKMHVLNDHLNATHV